MTPRIASPRTLDTSVQMVMKHGAGTRAERAHIAVGLLEHSVRLAYETDEPLMVPDVDIAAAEAILRRKIRGMVTLSASVPEPPPHREDAAVVHVVTALPKRRWKRAAK